MRKIFGTLLTCVVLAGTSATAIAGDSGEATLYERLGGQENIERIVTTTIDMHLENPAIASFFADVDREKLETHVVAFFAAGTGGPAAYTGRDMTSAHATMSMTDEHFDKAVADVLAACRENGVGDAEVGEVAAILESLRPAVMGTAEHAAAN